MNGKRITDTVYCFTSGIDGMPYEHRVTVRTDYDHHRGRYDPHWEDLDDEARSLWDAWLDAYHAQEVRMVEMHLADSEADYLVEAIGDAEWENLPELFRSALDEIQSKRNS